MSGAFENRRARAARRLRFANAVEKALVQIAGTRKHSLLRCADFRPEPPRSRLQVQLGTATPGTLLRASCARVTVPRVCARHFSHRTRSTG
jgi:hypothetical protein